MINFHVTIDIVGYMTQDIPRWSSALTSGIMLFFGVLAGKRGWL